MCRKEKHKNFLKVFSLYGLNNQKIIRQTSLNSYYILYAAKVSICTPFLYNLTPRTNYMICMAQSKMKMQSPLFKNYLILCEIRPFNPMQGPSKHEALFSCTDCMLVKTACAHLKSKSRPQWPTRSLSGAPGFCGRVLCVLKVILISETQ